MQKERDDKQWLIGGGLGSRRKLFDERTMFVIFFVAQSFLFVIIAKIIIIIKLQNEIENEIENTLYFFTSFMYWDQASFLLPPSPCQWQWVMKT